jgi:hypothetical protein
MGMLVPTRKIPNLVVRCDTSKYEHACGAIQTKHTVPPAVLYSNYWYQSGISNTMRNHLQTIVDGATTILTKIKATYPDEQIVVLDIGSNDNTLLRMYPKGYIKLGIDPSDIAARQKDEDIQVLNTIFPIYTDDLNSKIHVITSIACFYDAENPVEFARTIKRYLHKHGIQC